MDIEIRKSPRYAEVLVRGRLDAQWSGELDSQLSATVRSGARDLRLDMSGIIFMSSAGIRILIKQYKELAAIKGSFRIVSPSDQVRTVLEMAGLLQLLSRVPEGGDTPAAIPLPPESAKVASRESPPKRPATLPAAAPTVAQTVSSPPSTPPDRLQLEGASVAVEPAIAGRSLRLELRGRPAKFSALSFDESELSPVPATSSTMALGLGAFGSGFAECSGYFGEFLAAGGAAACIPANASRVPDFMVLAGSFIPVVQTLYAAVCQGDFPRFFQFESLSRAEPLSLSSLAGAAISLCASGASAFLMLAETSGLVGAHLTRSPMEGAGTSPWEFPGIRDRFSFGAEAVWPHSLALVAGIVADESDSRIAAFARPFGLPGKIGHFHAAALSYRALPEGRLEPSIIRDLFESQSLLGVIHLIDDDRPFSGIGQSRFLRGAVWTGEMEISGKGEAS